jgi:uncharacterized metal-binding protein YceD (DUF177 family)
MIAAPILSWPVDVAEIGEGGLVRNFAADAGERQALASTLGLRDLRALTADVMLTQAGRSAIVVDGRLHADIVQTCVVSLVPVEQSIDEPISIRFVRAADQPTPKPGGEVHLDAADIDPPEILRGPTIDLGPVLYEQFVLAIDPYPRAPGAELPAEAGDPGGTSGDSPFAVLAGLKRGPGRPD